MVQSAIDFGELVSQKAPAGAPIFDAVTRARGELNYVESQIPWWSITGGDATPEIVDGTQRAVDDVYDAAAQVRTDPDQPLAKTTYAKPTALPWGWIGAGAVVVISLAVYLHGKRSR